MEHPGERFCPHCN